MAELFTEKELAYLAGQRLGRLATVDGEGRPHVVPVGYRLSEAGTIEIAGPNMAASKKFKNIAAEPRVAFVVDDLTPPDEPVYRPGVGRGVEVLGRASLCGGEGGRPTISISPEVVYSWHVDEARRPISVLADREGRL